MRGNEPVVGRDSGVTATLSIAQAIIAMLRLRAFALSVLDDDGSLIGILSEGDLKEHLELDIENRRPRWLECLFRGNKLAIIQLRVDGRSFLEIRTQGVSTSVEIASLRAAIDLMKRWN